MERNAHRSFPVDANLSSNGEMLQSQYHIDHRQRFLYCHVLWLVEWTILTMRSSTQHSQLTTLTFLNDMQHSMMIQPLIQSTSLPSLMQPARETKFRFASKLISVKLQNKHRQFKPKHSPRCSKNYFPGIIGLGISLSSNCKHWQGNDESQAN